MSEANSTADLNVERKGTPFLSFLGALGAIAVFALVIWLAYLPNRPEPIDAQVDAERRANATETIAAGEGKLSGYKVINAQAGSVQIPIEDAMDLTVRRYQQQ